MFVLNLACLFFKPSGSLSSAVMLSSCCIKHRMGGVEHVVFKANTTEVDIFTGSTLAQNGLNLVMNISPKHHYCS